MLFMTKKVVLGLVLSLAVSSDLYVSSVSAQAATTTTAAPTGASTTSTGVKPAPTQTHGPLAFTNIASTAATKHIYYQGGLLNQAVFTNSNELWSLDITKSWSINSPAWSNITVPTSGPMGPLTAGHSATMSKDGSTFIVTAPSGNAANPFLYLYDIAAGTWSTVKAPAAQASTWSNRKMAGMVTNPNTGAIYYVGGSFADGTSTNELDMFQDNTWTAALATTGGVLNNFSEGTTHIYNNRIYIFGGISYNAGQRGFQSFQSLPYIDVSGDTPVVGTQLTLGPIPPPRQNHCSVLTASAKILIFGGYDTNSKKTMGDVWSLDLVTLTWLEVVPSNPAPPRYGHTCNIAGANMIVYGGQAIESGTGKRISYRGDAQVYDVMLSAWMSSYSPKSDGTPTSKPTGNGASSSGLSTGALIGIIIAAVAVVACIIGGILYKRRQKHIEIREAELEKEAYLASLRPEGDGGSKSGGGGGQSSYSPSRPAAARTPGLSHSDYQGMDQMLNSGAASPAMGGQGQNVQYLMQHLPDGTIAVQPVYLDHQAIQMQPSPNMRVTDANSPSGYVSPPMTSPAGHSASSNVGGGGGGYFVPPPSGGGGGGSNAGSYVLPPSPAVQKNVAYPQPGQQQQQDPFASPPLANAPLPPNYQIGSPQQMHPEQRRQ
ncbi:hypothetical protein BG004_002806 [Podila humilis]|nr:hypothetical protein BG004_002806 [Podila humilis]